MKIKCNKSFSRTKLSYSVLIALCGTLLITGCSQRVAKTEEKEVTDAVIIELNQTPSKNASIPKVNQPDSSISVDMAMVEVEKFRVSGARLNSKPAPAALYAAPVQGMQQENYFSPENNRVQLVNEEPLSTFSIDVDTASYANIRRMLNQGETPPVDAVRIEEMLNYFDYQYPVNNQDEHPFSVFTTVVQSPLNADKHIMRVALAGDQIQQEKDKKANLVFLLDVSGSMSSPNKLPLLKRALNMLLNRLGPDDTVSIVVYAGASGTVLEPTSADNKLDIEKAINDLRAGGSTNGAAGIELAYHWAQKAFVKDGINRVILATDGDFNVGITDHNKLLKLVEKQREKQIYLSVLGFGQGNYNDHLVEQLANHGNGNAAYIDSIHEARKVLVEEMDSTLNVIAKDVKIQVEFNPAVVKEYRLIGYENRMLNKEDFNNDKVDAGEIGAGHTVTALYELTLVDSSSFDVDPLRYGKESEKVTTIESNLSNELAQVKLRYKQPEGETSELLSKVIYKNDISEFESAKPDFQFATSVAYLGQIMRQSSYASVSDMDWVIKTALQNKGEDQHGYRAEFVKLAKTYQALLESGTVTKKHSLVYRQN